MMTLTRWGSAQVLLAGLAIAAMTMGQAHAQTAGTGAGTSAAAGATSQAGAGAAAATVAAPAVTAVAQDPIPDDPTLPKKKKKKSAALTPPAAADQPPVALDTGKTPVPTGAGTQAATDPAAPAEKMKKKKMATAAASASTPVAAAPSGPTVTATVAAPKKNARQVAAVSDPNAPVSAATPGCRTRSFLVNDYGKDGPTADAKRLLEADIAEWTKANNLQNIKISARDVQCEQFLNFIVFDEWTCTASAQICWK